MSARLVPFVAVLWLLTAGPGAWADEPGVVVEEVKPAGAAAQAGLQPGDLLVTWERPARSPGSPEPAGGSLTSPFTLPVVEMEQAPRGEVSLAGRRGGEPLRLTLPPGKWDLVVRPRFAPQDLGRYQDGAARVRAGDLAEGLARLRSLAAAARARADLVTAAWLLSRGLELAGRAGSVEDARALEADALSCEALGPREGAVALAAAATAAGIQGRPAGEAEARRRAVELLDATGACGLALATTLNSLGVVAWNRRDLTLAGELFRRALEIRVRLAPQSLDVAASLNNLGLIAKTRGDLAAAEELHRRALEIWEHLAPGSLNVAGSLNGLGLVAWKRGDLGAAEGLYRRALGIQERLAPGGLDVAMSLTNLGNIADNRGDLAAAEELYRRALEIEERRAPGSLDVAMSLNNLGVLAQSRGDLAAAEVLHRRALEIRERLAPGSPDVAMSLSNLGTVAESRGDLAAAEELQRRALEIKERLTPASIEIAGSLSNLGNVVWARGDLAAAEKVYRRALDIEERLAPGGLEGASMLDNLGSIARDRGDLAAAEELHRRALEIRERLAPGSLDVAASLHNLGDVVAERGDLAVADGLRRRAVEIFQRLAPGSTREAETLHTLGLALRRQGRRQEALELLSRAVTSLEAQVGRLGGTEEARSGFRARYHGFYLDLLDLLLELGRPADAFLVLERSRARGLLAMLAERDLVFGADLPAELERERRTTAVAYERTQARLGELSPVTDAEEVEKLLAELARLRRRQEEIREEVVRESPRLAALQYPQPLDVTAAARALDPGTVLLSFSVGKDTTHLFVLDPSGTLQVKTLAVGEAALRDEVRRFRTLVARGRFGTAETEGVGERGRQLYDLLLAPAEETLGQSERLLVIPDGPLHLLPFAALVRRTEATGESSRPWQYLVEWRPIHVAVSATVYDELRRRRGGRSGPGAGGVLVAFGDPKYPSAAQDRVADAAVSAALGSGRSLAPLPATRGEVLGIAGVYGDRSRVYLGEEATEERAKSLTGEVAYLHFATHGLLDERLPLDSALALTIPAAPAEGQENGLLQAWEVFERVRLDADLVVLSGCETALGGEVAGEGLIGLTRAFQYAGARSVLASLWSVADESTAELMRRFYGHLKEGTSTDEALRQAQLELLRGPLEVVDAKGQKVRLDATHPFFWAAFELIGDWR